MSEANVMFQARKGISEKYLIDHAPMPRVLMDAGEFAPEFDELGYPNISESALGKGRVERLFKGISDSLRGANDDVIVAPPASGGGDDGSAPRKTFESTLGRRQGDGTYLVVTATVDRITNTILAFRFESLPQLPREFECRVLAASSPPHLQSRTCRDPRR